MRKVVPVLVAVGLIILIAVGFVGFQVLDRYMPTKERADLAEVYDVSGDETAILYNYERQEQDIRRIRGGAHHPPPRRR